MFYSWVVGLMGVDEVHSPLCTYNDSTRAVFHIAWKKHEKRLAKLRDRARKCGLLT